MPVLLLLVFSFSLFACNKHKEIPANSRIVAKYSVHNAAGSAVQVNCRANAPLYDFLEMGKYDCSFKLKGIEYDIENKFVLDTAGYLVEDWLYLAEGPLVYDLEMIGKDKALESYLGLSRLPIYIYQNKVIDAGDTLEVVAVFSREKLLWVTDSIHRSKGRIMMYQYE